MKWQEILLKEYETCQSDNNGLGSQSWVSISIFMTVNLLVLVQVISQIILTSHPGSGYSRLLWVGLLGLAMIFILLIFKRWKQRIDFIIRLNRDRMREIEEKLGLIMWKNWDILGLHLKYTDKEKFCSLKPLIQARINQISPHYPQLPWYKRFPWCKRDKETLYRLPTTEGNFWKLQFKFNCIFPMLITLWILVMILEGLTYWPEVYRWLLN